MNELVRLLFSELADLEPEERERALAARVVAPEVRAEVESLLNFDRDRDHDLTSSIASVATEALRTVDSAGDSVCGPYRLIRLLGSGGMGSVYLAERSDGELQQKVAIKLLHGGADRASWRERFLRERQLLAYLNHPSVARVLDAGRTGDGRPYLAMEYVDGVLIDQYAAGRGFREQLALFLRVCEGVAHAHRHLIIHRDLKPSNILVDASGQPKLLDFGIAKLLDDTVDRTQTVERLLTPNYASPEQMRGAIQTTATDIYSLGAILYKLVTGRSPHESEDGAPNPIAVIAGPQEIQPAKRWNPDLPTDIDCILQQALRKEPEERYASVEAFAEDVRAFLDSRPVQARSGNAWYRTRKFARRYWLPVAAAAAVIASLSAGLYLANRERVVAESRFRQLRQLSAKVFALDQKIRDLPGSVEARRDIVSASLEYLEGLASQLQHDPDLAQEVADGYWQIAQIQGLPTGLNLGESAQAEASLKKADALTNVVLAARPGDRHALERSAFIAQGRMILAQQDHHRAEALAHARETAERVNQLLQQPHLRASEIDDGAVLLNNVALAYTNMHLYSDAVSYARRAVDLGRQVASNQSRVGQALSMQANALRYQGDLDGALRAIEEARSISETAVYHDSIIRTFQLYGVILRQGLILGEDGGVSLGRSEEAAQALQTALDMNERIARTDPNDSVSRGRVGTSARELGKIVRHSDPERALAIYDLGIRRLGEIPNNLKARRDQANLLAGSSYPLRSLHRNAEARRRIDAAIAIVKSTKDYPPALVPLDSELYGVLQARADSEAGDGEPRLALKLYEELFNLVVAGKPEPLTDLRDAPRMSGLYASLAALYRRTGQPAAAATMDSRRLDLWHNWQRKLPNNSFVQRQVAAQTN